MPSGRYFHEQIGFVMTRVLLILLLVFCMSSVGMASDFEDGVAAYNTRNYATAFESFMKAATAPTPPYGEWQSKNPGSSPWGYLVDDLVREGDRTKAQLNLGTMYENGQGVRQNHRRAVEWYTKAAEAASTEAQGNLAAMYFSGKGVPQDYCLRICGRTLQLLRATKTLFGNGMRSLRQ
jgi:TPR repeat protein